jgi:hypothetical protein
MPSYQELLGLEGQLVSDATGKADEGSRWSGRHYCEREGIAFLPWFPLGAGDGKGE